MKKKDRRFFLWLFVALLCAADMMIGNELVTNTDTVLAILNVGLFCYSIYKAYRLT